MDDCSTVPHLLGIIHTCTNVYTVNTALEYFYPVAVVVTDFVFLCFHNEAAEGGCLSLKPGVSEAGGVSARWFHVTHQPLYLLLGRGGVNVRHSRDFLRLSDWLLVVTWHVDTLSQGLNPPWPATSRPGVKNKRSRTDADGFGLECER